MKHLLFLPILVITTQSVCSYREDNIRNYFDENTETMMLAGIQKWVDIGRENNLAESGLFNFYMQITENGLDHYQRETTMDAANSFFNSILNTHGTRSILETVRETKEEEYLETFKKSYAFTAWDLLNESYFEDNLTRPTSDPQTDVFALQYLQLNETVSFAPYNNVDRRRAWLASLICLYAQGNFINSLGLTPDLQLDQQ